MPAIFSTVDRVGLVVRGGVVGRGCYHPSTDLPPRVVDVGRMEEWKGIISQLL